MISDLSNGLLVTIKCCYFIIYKILADTECNLLALSPVILCK